MKMQKGELKKEGVDPDMVTGGDVMYWLPSGGTGYSKFGKRVWRGILDKSLRLGG